MKERDYKRLPHLYNHLCSMHSIYFPELRVCQFIHNFFFWISKTKKMDPFFMEDDELVNYLNEYVGRSR